MDYSKYRQKYINFIDDYGYDDTKFKDHYIFEILYALELNLILWSDIPPNFDELYDLPHTMDYGVDLIDLEYTKTGQVKKYGETSCITWSALCKFYTYSTQVLDINTLILATTEDSKIDNLGNKKLIETNKIQLIRNDFDKLLQKYNNTQHEKEPVITYEIEKRHYLLDCYNLIKNTDKNILNLQLPCGTGKSYIMLYTILETLKTNPEDKFIIFCPWINLAKQFKRLFKKFNLKISLIGDRKHKIKSKSNVVICINPSVKHIKDIEFKYKFIDEAHHLEGKDSERKPQMNKIKAEKEINFSATFHNQDELDYKYPMNQAIEEGYISDYKLHIEYFTSGDKINSLIELIKDNIDWIPIFIYFNDTEKCIKFADLLNQNEISSDYLIGTDNVIKRNRICEEIENKELKVLCLCGMYNEGISIDNLQTVIFGDLRQSQINKIQIAMRANRLHKEKPYYRVVLPIIESDFNDKDISQLIRTFAIIDPRIKEAIKRKSSTRIQIRIDDNTNLEDAKLLYEQIYDRIGNMTNGLSQEEKVNEFLNFMKNRKTLIRKKNRDKFKFTNGQSMFTFWRHRKSNLQCDKEPYSKLLENILLKEDYENFKINNGIQKLTQEEKVNRLLEIMEERDNLMIRKENLKFSDDTYVYGFWKKCKERLKCDKEPYSKLLSNKIFKNAYEKFKKYKEIPKLTQEEKVNKLLEIMKERESTIPCNESTFSDNTNIYKFWVTSKSELKCKKKPYSKLLTNTILKEDYDRYKKNKDNIKLTQEEKVDKLLEIMEKRDTLIKPKEKLEFSDGYFIYKFWGTCKNSLKCEKKPYSKLLTNTILKENYEKYKIIKEKNKNKEIQQLTQEEKIDKLLEIMEKRDTLILKKEELKFSDEVNIFGYWRHCKRKLRCEKEPYSKLLENKLLKDNYEQYTKNKEKKNLSQEEKVNELLEIIEERDSLILKKEKDNLKFSDKSCVYNFQLVCKKKCDKEPYSKLLENKLFKDDYERYKKNKEKKNLSPEEKIDKLLEIMEERDSLISYREKENLKFSDDTYVYGFWNKCKNKKKCDKKPYSKLLENKLLKNDYNKSKKIKEKNKEKKNLSLEEKVNKLLEIMEERDSLIKKKEKNLKFSDDTYVYGFWRNCKHQLKCEKESYLKLLENKLLNNDYNKSKKIKEKNKEKKNLSPEEKVNELLEIMEERDSLISYREKENLKFSDGSRIYGFWGDCKYKKKCEKKPYSKLLENELLKEDYKQYKKKKLTPE